MDLKRYTHKPTEVTGVEFDGSATSAKDIQAWVQSGSGMLPVLAPSGREYALYIPTSVGSVMLNKGDTLIQSSPSSYWPITSDDLEASYDESVQPPA